MQLQRIYLKFLILFLGSSEGRLSVPGVEGYCITNSHAKTKELAIQRVDLADGRCNESSRCKVYVCLIDRKT